MFVQIFVYCWAGNEIMLKVVTAAIKRDILEQKIILWQNVKTLQDFCNHAFLLLSFILIRYLFA